MSIQTYLCLFAKVFTKKIDDINSFSKFFYLEYIFLSPYMLLAWVHESANKVISCLHGFSIQSVAGKCNEVNLSKIPLALKYHKILVVFKAAYPDVQKWECQIAQSGLSKRLCYSENFQISEQLRCKFSTCEYKMGLQWIVYCNNPTLWGSNPTSFLMKTRSISVIYMFVSWNGH